MTPVVRNTLLLTVDHAHSRLGQKSFSLCFNVPRTALIFQTAALCSRMITQDFQTEDLSIRGMWEQILIKHRFKRPLSAYLHVMRHIFKFNKNHTSSFGAVNSRSVSFEVLLPSPLQSGPSGLTECAIHPWSILCVCVVVFPCFFFTWIM